MSERGKARGVAADVTTVIAFVSFSIVYINLLFAADIYVVVLGLIPNNAKPLGWLVTVAAFAPLLLAAQVVLEFIIDYGRHVFSGYEPGTFTFLSSTYRVGMFFGIIVFVLVLSFFVAYQSNSYLTEIAPDVSQYIRALFGRS